MGTPTPQITAAQIDKALASGDKELLALAQRYLAVAEHPFYAWRPRPDQPQLFDRQTGFVNDRDHRVVVCLGGTGSGKSDAAAYRVAKFLLEEQAPPRPNTPFWVVSNGFDLTCGTLWGEKLSRFIPEQAIAGISWMKKEQGHPAAVRLKPWKGSSNNYVLTFKSTHQGRQKFEAASIAGAWVSEAVADFSIIEELQGRLRDYSFGQIVWDLCPLIPQPELERLYKSPPSSWAFYHLNSECNSALVAGYIDEFLATLPEEVRETRRIGAFGSYEGIIFKELQQHHVIEPFEIPAEWPKYRCLDFGNNLACVWMARDPDTKRWYAYHDYFWDADRKGGGDLLQNHAHRINQVGDHFLATFGDPADATSIRELNQHGIHCTGARKDVMASIELIRKLLLPQRDGEPGLYIFNTCLDLLQQMRAYRWMKGRSPEKDPKPEPLKFFDHAVDAAKMLLFSVLGPFSFAEQRGEFEPLAVTPKQSPLLPPVSVDRKPQKFRPLVLPPRRSMFGVGPSSRFGGFGR